MVDGGVLVANVVAQWPVVQVVEWLFCTQCLLTHQGLIWYARWRSTVHTKSVLDVVCGAKAVVPRLWCQGCGVQTFYIPRERRGLLRTKGLKVG